MNDNTRPVTPVQIVRDALREELDAINTYDILKESDPEHAHIYEEIKKDEINHSGRLTNILMEMDPGALEPFNKGLDQEEPNANPELK